MAERVAALLRRSVEHLAQEVPDSYRRILDELGSLVVELKVDGEVFALRGGRDLEVSDGAAQRAGTRIATSRAAVLDVLDAVVGLGEAVEADAVRVTGGVDDVLRAHDTLRAYVHAAVRAPSQPGLLAELRAGTS